MHDLSLLTFNPNHSLNRSKTFITIFAPSKLALDVINMLLPYNICETTDVPLIALIHCNLSLDSSRLTNLEKEHIT